ncbi:MAG: hypothetical protein QG674_416 [Patescibacteria group bacterium]|nr:hypothetical protein [Patescibacteria group bacterium]
MNEMIKNLLLQNEGNVLSEYLIEEILQADERASEKSTNTNGGQKADKA